MRRWKRVTLFVMFCVACTLGTVSYVRAACSCLEFVDQCTEGCAYYTKVRTEYPPYEQHLWQQVIGSYQPHCVTTTQNMQCTEDESVMCGAWYMFSDDDCQNFWDDGVKWESIADENDLNNDWCGC